MDEGGPVIYDVKKVRSPKDDDRERQQEEGSNERGGEDAAPAGYFMVGVFHWSEFSGALNGGSRLSPDILIETEAQPIGNF